MTSTPVDEAVRQRRTVYRFRPDPLSADLLEEILSAARYAPNHKHSQPWRFVVVRGDALSRLADLRVELQRRRAAKEGKPPGDLGLFRAEVAEAAAAVYVVQDLAQDEKRRKEDFASCAIVAYIVQLVAWERGVGARWNTGQIALAGDVRDFLGLSDDQEVAACLFLGYPEQIPPDWVHRPVEEVTRYIE